MTHPPGATGAIFAPDPNREVRERKVRLHNESERRTLLAGLGAEAPESIRPMIKPEVATDASSKGVVSARIGPPG